MNKVLITGKTSYVGSSFEKWVLKKYADSMIVESITVRDEDWKKQDFVGYDTVLHVAGIVHQKGGKQNADEYFRVNRDLTYELALKAKNENVKHFIFLSSLSVYGKNSGIINDLTVPKPNTIYGQSKYEAENLIKKLETSLFKVSIIRPPMIYGYKCKGNYLKLSAFSKKIPFFININNKRSMIFIDNLSEFLALIIRKEFSGIFSPQNKEYVCTSEMVELISKVNGKKIILVNKIHFFTKIFKRIQLTEKVFGDLIYEKKVNEKIDGYHVCDFEESIKLSERVE
ncbi:NAD-dependent epimerase/dehydratase family protein [Exiguobacterium sp. SH5S4]|uniref:NAD-dependent epimerase/dehydratase family protein n=1 Tax=Exiguobacterium sp. SH5S4 TaxID=2510961 RepID=UPI00103B5B6F|nr:NAD-dependent epimerase/dehydratase family protein [Exiguobacterium sp. SH5S4]TCI25132.1 NAD-dependent epimerase/dehydratase family protein [Exiguobacterium sp. SH5S4]